MATRNTASWYLIGWWIYNLEHQKWTFESFPCNLSLPPRTGGRTFLVGCPTTSATPCHRGDQLWWLNSDFLSRKWRPFIIVHMYLVFYIREVLRHDQDTQILHLHMVRLSRKKIRKFCGKPWQHRTQLRGETACARSIRQQRLNILFSGQGFTTDGNLQIMHSSLWERQNA